LCNVKRSLLPMTSRPPSALPRRTLPAGGPSVSLLGFVIDPPGPPTPTVDRSTIEMLRRARAAGVTVFDAASSRNPDRGLALLATAFPDADERLVVLVQPTGEEASRSKGGRAPRLASTASSVPTLLGLVTAITEREPGQQLVAGRATPARSAVRVDPAAESLPPAVEGGLYVGPFSLLDLGIGRLIERAPPGTPSSSVFARDPFAGGRLDGSRLAGGAFDRAPSMAPPSLRSLEEDFAPVLRLGFLTSSRVRTLAQASVQFVAAHPWVASVLAPLPPPDRLEELAAAFSRPPLSEAELARVESEDRSGP
jgi:hypothetical protein